jgi:hypothetical protein
MSSNQIRAIGLDFIESITTDQIVGMTSSNIASFSTDQIKNFNSGQLIAIETADIVGLTTNQIVAFDGDKIGVLTPAQVAALSVTQLRAIEVDDASAITELQLEALKTANKLTAFTTAQVAAMDQDLVATYSSFGLTPLVFDLNGDGIQTLSATNGVIFDVNNDGQVEKTGWVAATDGLLVRDLNGDGQINDGGELFGEGTVLADGTKAKDGYAALRALDSNFDGLIDVNDAAFNQLLVWTDLNSDGKANSCELASLSDMSIRMLSLDAIKSSEMNNGNLIGLMGSYTTVDGTTHTMGDVWFSVDNTGKKVFDLAAVVEKSGGVSHVDLKVGEPATLNVALSDVLSLGEHDVNGLSTVKIDGDAGDTVQLNQDGEGWSQHGTVTDGAQSYDVYVNQDAQLLVNHKLNTIII